MSGDVSMGVGDRVRIVHKRPFDSSRPETIIYGRIGTITSVYDFNASCYVDLGDVTVYVGFAELEPA